MKAILHEEKVVMVECPRDAWQGFPSFIPTKTKIAYLQTLIDAGFEIIDMGSFVSPKMVPQVKDTHEVLIGLSLEGSPTKLLVIVANVRGAEQAVLEEKISYLGYPFSISETFQFRNANCTLEDSFNRVYSIQELCLKSNKKLVIYISMAFGNPYGDPWSTEIVEQWIHRLTDLGIDTFSLADTVGVADPSTIELLFRQLTKVFPNLTLGVHLHSRPERWRPKVQAAFDQGCRRFDATLSGFGGCPFAQDDLVGNLDTMSLMQFLEERGLAPPLKKVPLERAVQLFHDKIIPYHSPNL